MENNVKSEDSKTSRVSGGGGDADQLATHSFENTQRYTDNAAPRQASADFGKPTDTAVMMAPDGGNLQRTPKTDECSCSSKFRSIVATLCGTRMLVSKYDREEYIRVTLVELIVYIVYLAVTCTITFGLTISSSFYLTNAVSNLFLDTPFSDKNPTTFRTSTTVEDFWEFTEKVMPGGLHWKYWYGVVDPSYQIPLSDQGVLYENRLLGRPRLRQIRVAEQKCPISEKFNRLFRTCYPPYKPKYEDKGIYDGSLINSAQFSTAAKYYSEKTLEGTTHWGRLATYSGGGAYQLLGVDAADTLQQMIALKNVRWITRATRVVFLDFTVFNANVNLFCIVKLVWEYPATGGLVPSWSIRTIRLDRYATLHEYFLLTLEIIFIFFTLYYTIQEFMEMCLTKCSEYWSEFWTYLDISILIISYVCIGFGFYRYFQALNTLQGLIDDPTKYSNFYWLGLWESQFNNCVAVLVFLVWIKIFKYISFNRTMSQLSRTISRCAKDVGGFAIMFFIVFFAFAQLGYLLFGSTVDDFRTFHDTIYTLLRLILGDFNFRAIEAANRILGPVFFITYVFFVFFVLLNMFLAIINDTYSEVKAEVRAQGEDFMVSDYLKRSVNNACGIFGCKSKKLEAEGKAKLSTTENIITNEELRENLVRSRYSDVEVEMFLTRFELDEARTLDADEAENVLGGLEGHHSVGTREGMVAGALAQPATAAKSSKSKQPGSLTDAEISELQSRVGVLESSLTNMTRKMDLMMGKLDTMEVNKREASQPIESTHF